jgi:hypothetical protein
VPIQIPSMNPVLEMFVASNVMRCPTLREKAKLRLSPLFEVRSVTMAEAVDGLLTDSAVTEGWWAFVICDDDVIGVAELTLTERAIAYGGVNTERLGMLAARALNKAERLVQERDANVWFLRIAPLFFTGIVVEMDGKRVLFPLTGSPKAERLKGLARRRIAAALERDREGRRV